MAAFLIVSLAPLSRLRTQLFRESYLVVTRLHTPCSSDALTHMPTHNGKRIFGSRIFASFLKMAVVSGSLQLSRAVVEKR
jgi:hypothetical protein